MTKGITSKEPDPEIVYADIIRHPHWVSPKHPQMSLYDRAAQFSAYKALSGYEDMVNEEARLADNKIELSEEDLNELNRKLSIITQAIEAGDHPAVTFTYFIPDPLKAGGRYETVTEEIRRVDTVKGKLILMRQEGYGKSNVEIDISNLLDIALYS